MEKNKEVLKMHGWYKEYDALIRKICPNYETALDALANEICQAEVIELGCGTGNLTEKLVRNGNKVIAYDINSSMLKSARDKKLDNVEFVEEDAVNVKYDSGKIVVSALLFHLLDKRDREEIFEKISGAGANLYNFDRIRGEIDEEEAMYQDNFRSNLKTLSTESITQLMAENKINKPDKLNRHAGYFKKRGYSFKTIFQDKRYGFAAYCLLIH